MLKLNILSPERRVLDGVQVDSVTLPGSEGQIQILQGHAAMIGTLETGIFFYQGTGSNHDVGVISTGFFEVKDDVVTVMAETVELKGDIDLKRARTAQQKAESALQEASLDEYEFKKYQLKMQRALIRQQVAAKDH